VVEEDGDDSSSHGSATSFDDGSGQRKMTVS
jgi:hypothetical protein